ncbi:hypothetical protein SAMD00019534_003380 [Acytostelium subglobosum LB1]|uniref:hypothetical protein n=1 Tax=Acytostelium subglobosum LB1 TaxID=1410327 RepID=UPI0006448738|nr:hypothetical protein SAMD00019534_003380 [Acytostelium subglobosum LB1]GAM17163.1 hypothetical protein SAMD00019534_003380 [Acytostelium subglobosum LB1]|eukprot:XP_012759225.1 hypothetical protein SAMD00019534_003380 [Acytostelium subglobosum LB1]
MVCGPGNCKSVAFKTTTQFVFSVNSIPTQGGVITFVGKFFQPGDFFSQFTLAGVDVPLDGALTIDPSGSKVLVNMNDNYSGYNLAAYIYINGNPCENRGWNGLYSFVAPTIKAINIVDSYSYGIEGTSFGKDGAKLKVTINGVTVDRDPNVLLNHTYIAIPVTPDLAYPGVKSIVITVGENVGSAFSYNFAPLVTAVTSVPTSGGTITITGALLNLLKSDGSAAQSYVNVGGINCINPTSVGTDNTKLTCKMPEGSGKDKQVIVNINGVNSTNNVLFSYGIPQITSNIQNGAAVTLVGSSFGDVNTGIIFADGTVLHPSLVYDNAEKAVFTMPSTLRNGNIYVTVSAQKSQPYRLSMIPSVDSISSSPTMGSTITISGQFLSTTDITGAPQAVVINTTVLQCANPRNPDTTYAQLLCDIPAGVGANHPTTITIDGVSSLGGHTFSFNAPLLQSAKQNGSTLYLFGDNFGPDASSLVLHAGNMTYDSVTVTNSSVIELAMGKETAIDIYDVTVAIDNQVSSEIQVLILPSITSITKVQTTGGIVTIVGSMLHFKRTPGFNETISDVIDESKYSIALGDKYSCHNVVLLDNTTILCNVIPGVGKDFPVNLSISNLTTSIFDPIVYFSYEAPTVSEILQTCTQNGGTITIRGSSLGVPINITVGQLDCNNPVISDAYNTDVVCDLPAWPFGDETVPEGTLFVNVTVGGQTGSNEIFKYDLTDLLNQRAAEANRQRMKWLIPAIVVPSVVGLAALVGLTVFLVKRHMRDKELRKMFRK